MTARSRLSRAPTMSSRAVTCERTQGSQRVYILDRRRVAARYIDQNIAVDQEGHASVQRESAVEFAAKAINVFHTVGDVFAILP